MSSPTDLEKLRAATRTIHDPIVTALDGVAGTTHIAFGAVMGLRYDQADAAAYRLAKVPTNFVGPASFHVHWTKADDTAAAGTDVCWVIEYRIFDGHSQEITGSGLRTEAVATYEDPRSDSSRVVYRTANVPAIGLIGGNYLGIKVTYDTDKTSLPCPPVLLSVDLLYSASINQPD